MKIKPGYPNITNNNTVIILIGIININCYYKLYPYSKKELK